MLLRTSPPPRRAPRPTSPDSRAWRVAQSFPGQTSPWALAGKTMARIRRVRRKNATCKPSLPLRVGECSMSTAKLRAAFQANINLGHDRGGQAADRSHDARPSWMVFKRFHAGDHRIAARAVPTVAPPCSLPRSGDGWAHGPGCVSPATCATIVFVEPSGLSRSFCTTRTGSSLFATAPVAKG